ncbi:metallophosphoesterase family protein [Nocardioides lijunqiniae]|uniref:metallophosphoesterase family protein n=1 Tax=Nocardioides lijunqiniae TaxID=2760832 RepID=UPI00187832EA|nr:metallophosphoesterase [Nocardioides lijunqiniae]
MDADPDDASLRARGDRRRVLLSRTGRHALRMLVAIVLAGVLGSPLALSWALTHTEVEAQIGTSPTTFSLSTEGRSEVRLGIAGTVYVPESNGAVGLVATVNGPGDPGAGDGDIADYARPEMLQLYAGLFHDPSAAVQEYVDLVQREFYHQLLLAELVVAVGGGAVGLALLLLLRGRRETADGGPRRAVAGGLVVLLTTSLLAWAQVQTSDTASDASDGAYALPIFDGTLAEGSSTNSPVLRAVLGGAVSKAQVLVRRQEEGVRAYEAKAAALLDDQQDDMEGPREGEVAVLMQSDMHCSTAMIRLQSQVVQLVREQHGDDALSLLAVAGDLTTNGTAAEGTCIRKEAAIADGMPIAAITGNHESGQSADQMADAGMTVLDGESEELGGVRVLGDGDPSRTELFGGSALRGDENQQDQGTRLFDEAESGDRPDLVMMHEGYAVAAFLDVDDMRDFLDTPGSLTEPTDDGVRDLPAGAVFYGHWHRSVEPRVVWNSDGTWTFVMELGTSGGALASSTINNFSTPWSSPLQQASFPVVFLDEETRLVTGYQLYRFEPDGTAVVEPRVDVGAP